MHACIGQRICAVRCIETFWITSPCEWLQFLIAHISRISILVVWGRSEYQAILLSTASQNGEWSFTIWDALSNRKLGLGAWLRPREPDYLLLVWESPTTSNPTNLGWVALCSRPCPDLWSLVVWIFVKIRSVFQNQSNRNRRHKREEKAIWWATHWLPPYYFLAAPPTLFPLIMNSNRWSRISPSLFSESNIFSETLQQWS